MKGWSAEGVLSWCIAFWAAQWLSIPVAAREALGTLVLLMVIDIVTGMWANWGRITSERGTSGISKKLGVLGLLFFCHFLEDRLKFEMNIELGGAVGYGFMEVVSIIENVAKIGVPIDERIVTGLLKVKATMAMRAATTQQIKALRDEVDSSTPRVDHPRAEHKPYPPLDPPGVPPVA